MMNAFATAISIGLQYGVPLETFVRKFSYMRFDPEGMTTNPEIPFAKSLPDYIMRWLASRFLDPTVHEELGIMSDGGAREEDGRGSRVRRRRTAATGTRQRPRERRRLERRTATARPREARGQAADRGADRHAAGRPGQDRGPRPRPGLLAVRRHDAAHGLAATPARAAATTPAAASSRGSSRCPAGAVT